MMLMISKLKETTNLFALYRHVCGDSEVPEVFHFWSCVSLIAAVVEDRVWFQKFKHESLFPNLFVMLVGPSGLGKGTAIGNVMRLANESVTINRYRGRTTAAHLVDHLGKMGTDEYGRKVLSNPKLWLVMDELSNDISTNKSMVREFVFMMTELYTASGYKMQTGTRTHGQVNIDNPLVNWLAGTTEGCLRDVLSKDLLESGFTARTCFIFGDYDFAKRRPRITYPIDYDEVFEHLCLRMYALQQTTGVFKLTDAADSELEKWYNTRPEPREELLYSAWKRHHDLMLKFAMILCLAGGGPMVIQHGHIVQAQYMVKQCFVFAEKVIEIASEGLEVKVANLVEKRLVKGEMRQNDLLAYFRLTHGVGQRAIRQAIDELVVEERVGRKRDVDGKVIYFSIKQDGRKKKRGDVEQAERD